MGWRFRKVFSRGPLRLTLSRGGVGWSWGIPGLRYGVSATGQRYVSVGFPGFGLYWIKYLSSHVTQLPRSAGIGSGTTLSPPQPIYPKQMGQPGGVTGTP